MVNNLPLELLEGLFPNHCALCGLRSHRRVPLCHDCEREMPLNSSHCKRCAIPLPVGTGKLTERLCGHCLEKPPPFERVIAPWLYGEYLAYLIQQWKYHGERRLTTLLAALWQQQAALDSAIDVLVPVPLHWRRRWQRGFNQSELLSRQLLANCTQLKNCKLGQRMVKRVRPTAAQSTMGARRRIVNLEDAFTVRQPCDNLRVAIVDDVFTTGATAVALARALSAAGAVYIEVWCLARTPAPGG
ncbi:MAG: ComF family protein [Halioglobus sp.]